MNPQTAQDNDPNVHCAYVVGAFGQQLGMTAGSQSTPLQPYQILL